MKKTLLIVTLLVSSIGAFAQTKNTSQSYIEKFKENAVALMHETGVPASIILGVAMHESGNGNSSIAQNLNNQFGMKGGGGATFKKNKKTVHSAYKRYDSILESFQDFANNILRRQQNGHMSAELPLADYEKWVHGIAKSGYASSKKWSADVLSIIRKYSLNDLDSMPGDKQPADAKSDPPATNTGGN